MSMSDSLCERGREVPPSQRHPRESVPPVGCALPLADWQPSDSVMVVVTDECRVDCHLAPD